MRIIFILFFICVSVLSGHCQDTLYTKSRVPFPVKVIELNETEVRYKNFSNLEGPIYVVKRSQVLKIVYQNGIVELPSEKPIIVPGPKPSYPWFKGFNTFSVVITDFLFSMATINFERTFLNDRLGIRIPLSIGFHATGNDTNFVEYSHGTILENEIQKGYYNSNKIYSSGFDILVYPFNPGKVNYFVGTSFVFGQINLWSQLQYYNPNPYLVYRKDIINFSRYMIKNGVNFRPTKNLASSPFRASDLPVKIGLSGCRPGSRSGCRRPAGRLVRLLDEVGLS
jgi:hypothetical protein